MSDAGRRPGLQAERTVLAWQRTGLGFIGVAALLTHAAGALAWVPALLLGVSVLAVGERRRVRVGRALAGGGERVVTARGPAAAVTGAVILLAGLGLVVVLRG